MVTGSGKSELIPAPEATMPLGLTVEQIRRRIQSGQLEGELVAGRYFVRRSALERAMRERAAETAGR